MAIRALAREQSITVWTLRRRGEKFLIAVGTLEQQEQAAGGTARIVFAGLRAAARADCSTAHAAHTIGARDACTAVWARFFARAGFDGHVDERRAARRAAHRARRNLSFAGGTSQDEDGSARGARQRIAIDRCAAGGASFAAAVRANKQVVRHELAAVRARFFLVQHRLAVGTARIGGKDGLVAGRAGQGPRRAARQAGGVHRTDGSVTFGTQVLSAFGAIIVPDADRRPAVRAARGDCLHAADCSTNGVQQSSRRFNNFRVGLQKSL